MTRKEWKQELVRGAIWLICAFSLFLTTRAFTQGDLKTSTISKKIESKADKSYVDQQDLQIVKNQEKQWETHQFQHSGEFKALNEKIDTYHQTVLDIIRMTNQNK
jgi:hypothetical protein